MKKFVALLLALVMVFALAACGNSKAPGTSTPGTDAPSTGAPSTDAPSTNAPVDEP